MHKILIVEDEAPISNLIRMNLSRAGYCCKCAFDGEDALNKIEEEHFDLIMLDIMLPVMNGHEVLEYVKELGIPVIFLTAVSTVEDKVRGLREGADDYITKPFEIIELLARVEAVLRRYNKAEQVITLLDIEIDIPSRVVIQKGKQVMLTLKEFDLLLLFARNKNVALYRDTIYEHVWDSEYLGNSRTIDLHVQRLKKKLDWDKEIIPVYKVGYKLEV